MSNAAISWATPLVLRPQEKVVLLLLANRANDENQCWPSIATLAEQSGYSERTVQRALRGLEASGVVTYEGEGGRTLTRRYTLCVGACVSPFIRKKRVTPGRERVTGGQERVTDATEKGDSLAPESKENPQEPKEKPQSGGDLTLFGEAPVGAILVNGKAAAFEKFWRLYPHRLSSGRMVKPDRLGAERAFAKALRRATPEAIIAAVERYPFPRERPKFIPSPERWLNAGSYLADVGEGEPEWTGGLDEIDRMQEAARLEIEHEP